MLAVYMERSQARLGIKVPPYDPDSEYELESQDGTMNKIFICPKKIFIA